MSCSESMSLVLSYTVFVSEQINDDDDVVVDDDDDDDVILHRIGYLLWL